MKKAWIWLLPALLALAGCGTVSPALRAEAARVVAAEQPREVECDRADACAQPSPLLAQVVADGPSRHRALILDEGQDALLARIHMIRAARHRIDLQTYIYDEDDSARLILRELVAAARRGVKVRMLIDQLSAMKRARTLAALAGVHANLEVRLYNPVFGRGIMSPTDYVTATFCCFRRLNQRMHGKLLLVDDQLGLTGGRNYQDDYFDWDSTYDFRDRDLLVSGPVIAEMRANFEAFWVSPRSVTLADLADVARVLKAEGVPELSKRAYRHPERARLMQAAANDQALLRARLLAPSRLVAAVEFVADLPQKHRRDAAERRAQVAPSSDVLYRLVESAREEVLLQTPYLVLSKPARALFTAMRRRPEPPRVVISTNSLAATDAFMVYALSHKYKRRYLRRFGFEIYEYKPFPEDAPIDLFATRALAPAVEAALAPFGEAPPQTRREPADAREYNVRRRFLFGSSGTPVPLKRAGLRIGLHAKSMVVDEGIGVIGTHNFDPRGDNYNTESAVIIHDAAFARELAESIRRDIAPANSWTIAPREKFPILPGLGYSLLKVSEHLPVFDLMPLRYATSYQFMPGPDCPRPLRPYDPAFYRCYRAVGDFPEVNIGPKWLGTRILTAFGAGLAPIL
ncbi:phospholipase D family protein [Lysobacter pythonis]|uniref:Phospholipase D family protein n=1 Tax=Solilutibacter pythonis TaxID=2483112 RepID=A0A3M2HU53_9GAMM|nr:phospholipase D family protein [Lysobacter pythonis]RMH90939.1 phospholipase D family protein [Lysobacter pythonis]